MSFYKCIQAYGRKDLNINTPHFLTSLDLTPSQLVAKARDCKEVKKEKVKRT